LVNKTVIEQSVKQGSSSTKQLKELRTMACSLEVNKQHPSMSCLSKLEHVHSCQQKSIGLKFSKSQTGSDGRYRCHHNSSLLLSPYLRICAVSLSSIHYNQSHRVHINRRRQYICL